MTEKTRISEIAFLLAFFAAPCVVAVGGYLLEDSGELGFRVAVATAIALPGHVLVGAPFLLFGVARGWRLFPLYALLAVAGGLLATPIVGFAMLVNGDTPREAYGTMTDFGEASLVSAPLVGAVFGLIFWLITLKRRSALASWAASPLALLRTLGAQVVAPLLLIAPWVANVVLIGGAPLDWKWLQYEAMDPLFGLSALGLVSAPVFYGLRIFDRRSLLTYALAGVAVSVLFTPFYLNGELIAPIAIAASVLNMLLVRALAGVRKPREATA